MAHDKPSVADEKTPRKFKNIKTQVNIHDRTQLETIFSYNLPKVASGDRSKPEYKVDAYLFFPTQMDIDPATYPKEKFYMDMRAMLRLREPKLSYKELMGLKKQSKEFSESPLKNIEIFLQKLKSGDDSLSLEYGVEEVRVFGCSFVRYYWRRIERRAKKATKVFRNKSKYSEHDRVTLERQILELVDKGYTLLKSFREFEGFFEGESSPELEAMKIEIRLVNEYCSYCFRDGVLKILGTFAKVQHEPQYSKILNKLNAYLRLERWYAGKLKFYWLSDTASRVLMEDYIFRRGALKRRVWSVLYLNPRRDALNKIRQQVGAMIAAGLAAAWASAATLAIWTYSSFKGFAFVDALSSKNMMFIFVCFVFSYMMKDRIKEVAREWLTKSFFGGKYDLINKIYYSSSKQSKLKIGLIGENVEFLQGRDVPSDIKILKFSHSDIAVDLDADLNYVLKYSKFVKLNQAELNKIPFPIKSVYDIFRLNIESYLPKLDAALHLSLVPDDKRSAVETMMPKVYYIDLILKFHPFKQVGGEQRDVVLDPYRLVIDKRGLQRIERLK